jgi:hypothetical protein
LSPSPDLLRQAKIFAGDLSDVLNRTVTQGVKLSAVLNEVGTRCIVAKGVTPRRLTPQVIPLSTGRKPRLFLRVAHTFHLDHDEGLFLTAAKTDYTAFLDEEGEQMVFHYDYDRSPANEYPKAHFQLSGQSPAFDELCNRSGVTKELQHFHFPVGGARFRPTLEDVIEFLVVEGLVESHEGYADVIEHSRSVWFERQLLAAVRNNKEVVRAYLGE